MHELADIQREQEDPACADTYRESLGLDKAIGDTVAEGVCAFNLGHAYKDIVELRDLDEAERWYRQRLDLRAPGDDLGRGRSLAQLGGVACERFEEARDAERPADELARHPTDAMRSYTDALDLLPDTAVHDRGVIHNQLGTIWANAGDIDRALHHFQQDIRYCEQAGDLHGAGVTRRNSARVLAAAGRLDDARVYADAALANFREFGDRAADDIQHTEDLIAAIDQAEAQAGSG